MRQWRAIELQSVSLDSESIQSHGRRFHWDPELHEPHQRQNEALVTQERRVVSEAAAHQAGHRFGRRDYDLA